MALQDMFAKQLQEQIKLWEGQAKEIKAKSAEATAQVRAEYDKSLENLDKSLDQARKMLPEIQKANASAWKDMEASTSRAFDELKKGWEEAIARYK